MDYNSDSSLPFAAYLVQGCWREADRADIAALRVEQLRVVLPESLHGHMIFLIEEMRGSGRLLRDLGDRSQVHISRAPIVVSHLNLVLPCLCKTLRDITAHLDDKTLSREIRWRKMYHNMTEEAGGVPLPQRFVLYNHFLSLLKDLLTRSPSFDLNTLDTLCRRLLELRELRGIPPPRQLQIGPLVPQDAMSLAVIKEPNAHWAEQIFSLPLPSRTALKHLRSSRAYGPFFPYGHLNIPADSKILFRRAFDEDKLSVTAFLNSHDGAPYLMICNLLGGTPWHSLRGAHELCIGCEGSALQLKRWSHSEQCSKPWAALYFLTWEEMVLFYCTFIALKARNPLTTAMDPNEYKLQREKRLFQAQIHDDGYKHSLIVYEDLQTQGIRLHAAVWDGVLRQCPVWTAFVTRQSQSPTWISRRGIHRVRLKDVQLYVFCDAYRQENMRQNHCGAFEIDFVSGEAAARFKDLFSTTSASLASSEAIELVGDSSN